LIEAVYDEAELEQDDPLFEAWDRLDTKKINLEDEADLRLAAVPDPDYPFYRGAKPRDFREDEESSGWLVAPTRWGAESVTVIPLVQQGELAQTVTGDVSVSPQQRADRDTQLKLLRHNLRLSDKTPPPISPRPTRPSSVSTSTMVRTKRPQWQPFAWRRGASRGTVTGVARMSVIFMSFVLTVGESGPLEPSSSLHPAAATSLHE
jgi:hypothetical protein